MDYQEIIKNAREKMAPQCRVCRNCNGQACRGEIPGTGGKGSGSAFIRSRERVEAVRLNLDVLCEYRGEAPSCQLFGMEMAAPVFAAPISGMATNYNGYFTEKTYAAELVPGCAAAGTVAFTGDGAADFFFTDPLEAVRKAGGRGIPTIKPWDFDTVLQKIRLAEEAGAKALCMDIDSAGLPLLAAAGKPVTGKSRQELEKIIASTEKPFIVKGIMTVRAAKLAEEAGAAGIVVSNHGGRVLDDAAAPFDVLEEIAQSVHCTVLVDSGIRTGYDVFKALALGADGVLIGRPYVTAAYGGMAEGVEIYTRHIIDELKDAMKMTGCSTLAEITREKVRF